MIASTSRPGRTGACRIAAARASGAICSISSVTTSTVPREVGGGVGVVERRGDDAIDDGARGAVGVGIEHLDVVAERARRHRRHAAELAAAEDADRRAREDRSHQRRRARCRCRRAPRRSALRARRAAARGARACMRATIAAASSAAFAAPGSPMASVPTGTPFGICTIESSASTPLSAVAGIGTPSTGRTVLAATIPGQVRRAAGGGDDDLEAARLGALGVLEHPVGRAMRGDDAHLVRNVELGRAARRARDMIFRSLRLPMMIPTRGRCRHDEVGGILQSRWKIV